MTDSKPSINRLVHYVSHGSPDGRYASVCRAAIMTQVDDTGNAVGLMVMNPTGVFFNECVEYDKDRGPGTWHWPEMINPGFSMKVAERPSDPGRG